MSKLPAAGAGPTGGWSYVLWRHSEGRKSGLAFRLGTVPQVPPDCFPEPAMTLSSGFPRRVAEAIVKAWSSGDFDGFPASPDRED